MSANRSVTDTTHQCTKRWRGKQHLEELDVDGTTRKSVNTGRDLIWFYIQWRALLKEVQNFRDVVQAQNFLVPTKTSGTWRSVVWQTCKTFPEESTAPVRVHDGRWQKWQQVYLEHRWGQRIPLKRRYTSPGIHGVTTPHDGERRSI